MADHQPPTQPGVCPCRTGDGEPRITYTAEVVMTEAVRLAHDKGGVWSVFPCPGVPGTWHLRNAPAHVG